MEKRDLATGPFIRVDLDNFVLIDPKIVARIEHIEVMLEALEKKSAAEARVRMLEEALREILEHKGVPCLEDDGTVSYAPSVGPLKNIALAALKGGTPDGDQ